MRFINSENAFKFYFITDPEARGVSVPYQVESALAAGATMIQYRNKSFKPGDIEDVRAARALCSLYRVPFIVNDDLLLAIAVGADGVHLGQGDDPVVTARKILGKNALIGLSVSSPAELRRTDISGCDYLGVGPVFSTATKADAKPVIGLDGLRNVARESPLPVVAIGGITAERVASCLKNGAAGCAVISAITRQEPINAAASRFGLACGCSPRPAEKFWRDEFGLIKRLTGGFRDSGPQQHMILGPGDDAALFRRISRPVFTTDTQREGVHFRREWQKPAGIGKKAVEIVFSDLAASYAKPIALFINLSLPCAISEKEIKEIYDGVREALYAHDAVLGGGNITGGSDLAIDLFAVGEAGPGPVPRRSAARPGNGLYVTGPLGLARAGLACLENNDHRFPGLVERFLCPKARFDAARVLEKNGVACVMDISDGLAGDAFHIAEASGVSISFLPGEFCIDPLLEEFCRAYGRGVEHEMLSGGEDYELLFACEPEIFERIRSELPDAFKVGTCLDRKGEPLLNLPEGVQSFSHGPAFKG